MQICAPKTSAGQSIDGALVFADIGCRCSTTHCCWKFPFALPLQSCGWGMLIRTTHSSECTPIGKRAWAKATTPVETVAQSIATGWLSRRIYIVHCSCSLNENVVIYGSEDFKRRRTWFESSMLGNWKTLQPYRKRVIFVCY